MKDDFHVGQVIPFKMQLFIIKSIKLDRASSPKEVQIKLVRLNS